MSTDDDLMNLLEAISKNEPCDRVPDVQGIDRAAIGPLMGRAYRAGWINVSSYVGDGIIDNGPPLMLTGSGRTALADAIHKQDANASEPTGVSVDEKRRNRTSAMEALYDLTGGNTQSVVQTQSIAGLSGLSENETKPVVRYLQERGLLDYVSFGGWVSITSKGVDEVEEAKSPNNRGTENLDQIVITARDISGGTFQLGNRNEGDISSSTQAADPALRRPGFFWGLARWVQAISVTVVGGLILGLIYLVAHLLSGHDTTASANHGSSTTAASSPSATVTEFSDNHQGSPVFANPSGDAAAGVPAVIPYGTQVSVSCFTPNTSGGISSATAFYLVADGRWKGDYVVADTMTNGGPLGNTNSPNVDPKVPACH